VEERPPGLPVVSRPARTLLLLAALLAGCSRIVILHDPLTAAEHNDLGVAYEAAGKHDLAHREYRKALKLDAGFVRARVNLGNLESAAGRWKRAEDCYRRALRDASGDADALNNLAVALVRQQKSLVEAESLATRAVAAGGGRDSIYRATLAEVRAARGVR
jgi:tetratricopeptide (TPR) repeat protein